MKFEFEVLAWDLARVSDVFRYQHEKFHAAGWGIKGHNRPWIIDNGQWRTGMRFLDVGAGYSDLAAHLAERFNMDGWVADDFGMNEGEGIWSRWGNPSELPQKYPGVNYVFHNLGQPTPELPEGSFDRIYSVSTLEHIPPEAINDVLLHMARLLKPGGLMLHTVDLPFPRTIDCSGPWNVAAMLARIGARQLLAAIGAPGHRPYIASIKGWSVLLKRLFCLKGRLKSISTMQMILDHNVLVEPPEVIYRYYPPNDTPKLYWRAASLTFILRKASS
jgi:SAM-dependent methyltransferase